MENIITDANINEILGGTQPVMIDFWATWCGPCRAIGPVVEELAGEYDGKVFVGKCNVDENQDIPVKYGIRNIPTLLFFKNGEVVDKLVGASPKAEIAKKLDALL